MPRKSRGAKPSRIDGIVCNLEAAALIHSFKVEKDEMIPTHSIVKITVSRNAMKQKGSFVRSLPSLKKACDTQIEDVLKNKEEQQQEEVKGERTTSLCTRKKGRAERNH